MNTIRDLLRDADPLGYESQTFSQDRDRRRQALLTTRGQVNPRTVRSLHLPIAVLAGMAVAVIAGVIIGSHIRQGAAVERQAPVRFDAQPAEGHTPKGLREMSPQTDEESAYRPGNGVSSPQLLKEVKAHYTPGARRARIEGDVLLDCVVEADGTVGSGIKVIRSLDPKFGLDQEAVKAARQWLFKPGMKGKTPVPVRVTIEIAFSLKNPNQY